MQDETEFILTIIITISLLQKDNHKIIIFFLKQNRPQQLLMNKNLNICAYNVILRNHK